MKKWIVGGVVASVLMIGGIGAVWADEVIPSFEQMLPFMQKMHPNVDKDTLQNMYNTCKANGMMSGKGVSKMMGNFQQDTK